MTVTILLITGDLCVLSTSLDAFPSTGAYETSTSYDSVEAVIQAVSTAIANSNKPAIIGYPPHWPKALVGKLKKALIVGGVNVGQVAMVPSSLLSAYGCNKGTALVIEIGAGSEEDLRVVTMGVIVDGQPHPFANSQITSQNQQLGQILQQVLSIVDADRRALIMDNLIVTGLGWTMEKETKVVQVLSQFATVSTFPGDHQVRAITTRHCPEYHTELFKVLSGDQLQPVIALFGACISGRALLTESSRQQS